MNHDFSFDVCPYSSNLREERYITAHSSSIRFCSYDYG